MEDVNGCRSEDRETEQDIAVIGLSCRFGGDAKDPRSFWDLLCQSESAHSKTAGFDNHYDTKFAGYHIQDNVYNFDSHFFDISPKEAKSMDPSQRLMLEVAFEAFESAGLSLETVANTNTSCYAAQFGTDYREMLARDPNAAPTYTFTGTGTAMLSNRLSWFFDLKGPSFTLNTACSASMVALHEGCESLRRGESDAALIAGANLMLSPDMFTYARSQNFLSPDGKCKSFDVSGDGYGRGDGIAALVLKPVDLAVRNGDPIRAVIRGSGVNQNGRMKGITLPSMEAQKALIEKTYRAAKLDFDGTSYVEAHGTGTKAGDPIELEAIGRTLGQRHQDQKLLVGSVKPNIGHTEATAGIAGVIKGVFALESGYIPPNIYFTQPNPNIQFDEWMLSVPTKLTRWPSGYSQRRISACSTGYGGTNAHIIMDDAFHYLKSRGLTNAVHFTTPPSKLREEFSGDGTRSSNDLNGVSNDSCKQLFILSADDEGGVERQLDPLAEYCARALKEAENEAGLFRRLVYTLNHKRTHLRWNASVIASSLEDLQSALTTLHHSKTTCSKKSQETPGVAFVFNGQGAQWAQMGQALYHESSVFRESLDGAEAFFKHSLDCPWSVTEELFREESSSCLEDPTFAQPLTTVLQMALVDLLESWNVQPNWIVGHSSGEIAGAYCLGALTQTHAWIAAYYRGVFQPDQDGSMMAVGMSASEAESLVAEHAHGKVVVACVNSPQSVTLSGDSDYVEKLQKILGDRAVFARILKVRTAYHSHHMQRIAADYESALSDIQPKESLHGREMFSAVTGQAVDGKELGPSYWVKNLVSPVRFSDAVDALLSSCDTPNKIFVEVGPHQAMQAPLKQIFANAGVGDIECTSILIRGKNAVNTALAAAGNMYGLGVPVDIEQVNNRIQQERSEEPKLLVDLPPYAWKHDQTFSAITPSMQANSALPTARHDVRPICTTLDWQPAPEINVCDPATLEAKQKELVLLMPAKLTEALSSMEEIIVKKLGDLGFEATTSTWPTETEHIQGRRCISLVELAQPMFLDASAEEFSVLRETVLQCEALLWLSPDSASGSIVPGLARTVRNEVPGLTFRSLQLGASYLDHVDSLCSDVARMATSTTAENEFREENANILVPRVKHDDEMNEKLRHFSPGSDDKSVPATGSDDGTIQLSPNATYVLVGGLGGLGRSLANFLVDIGARHIYFVSRSGSESSTAQQLLTELRERDVQASSYKGDVSNMDSLRRALDKCDQEHPPIKGVIQCAMVLQDVTFSKMTHEQWQKALRPKVQGSLNLSLAMSNDVDFFIMLSSFTGTFGNRTQGNYVAACAFQDNLAYECRARGQKAVSLDLGVMRDVGYLAEHGSAGPLKEWEEHFGLREWELKALVHASVADQTPTQVITGLPSAKGAEEAGIMPPFYLSDPKFALLAATEDGEVGSPQTCDKEESAADLKQNVLEATTKDEAKRSVSQALRSLVAKSLQSSKEDIDMSQSLHAHGADSLVGIELQNWLFQQLSAKISQGDLMADAPMTELGDQIVSKCELLPASLRD